MRPKSERDFVAGLLFMLTGGAFAWGALGYGFGNGRNPGPGYFPFGLGLLLALLGGFLVFRALTVETDGREPIGRIAWRPLLAVVGAIAFFAAALPRLGLPLTVAIATFGVSFATPEARWRPALLLALVIFWISAVLAGRSASAERFREKLVFWLNVNVLLSILIVMVGGFMRMADRQPKPKADAGAPAIEKTSDAQAS